MTDHAVEIVTATSQKSNPSNEPSPGPPDWVDTLLEDRMKQNVEGAHTKADIPAKESAVSEVSPLNGTTHYRGQRAFDGAEDKVALLDDIENKVVTDAEWYEVRHHDCTHNSGGGACPSWTVERSDGTVPDDV